MFEKIKKLFQRGATRSKPGPKDWYVHGRVTGSDGLGVPNLRVSIYDKDLLFDDRLGEVTTGPTGEFHCMYRSEDFKDLFQTKPDLYVKVLNQNNQVLYSSESAIRIKSERVERFDIKLDKDPY
ncbi:hypothetical protein ACFLT7_06560 [candidate division KSB1 bacterium]